MIFKLSLVLISLLLVAVSIFLLFIPEKLNRICSWYNKRLEVKSKWQYNTNDEVVFAHRFSFGIGIISLGLIIMLLGM